MQEYAGRGEEGGRASAPPQPGKYRRTNPANLPQSSGSVPAYSPENEIDMQEGTGGVKRSQAEPEENSHNEKWRKREGIKRRLQDEPTQPTIPKSSSTMPIYQENEIYMLEGAGGVKRGQTELEKNLHHDKWRKQEGIKRGLRDIPHVPYEE